MKKLLGYSSHRSCVEALRSAGLGTDDIVAHTGLDLGNVRTILSQIQRQEQIRYRARLPAAPDRRAVWVDGDSLRALTPAAERRRMSEAELVRFLLDTIAEEPALVDAVLDDGVGP